MTTLLLIRHGSCDHVGRSLAGRAAGVHLDAEGRTQAARLAECVGDVGLDGVFSSPLERALETAAPIAARAGREVEVLDSLVELDFARWTGCTFAELGASTEWRRFNELRSVARVPGGESMLEVQARAVEAVETIRPRYPEGRCALVSHGDVIRGLIAHYAGIPLDLMQRLEISPASVSVVRVGDRELSIRCVNWIAGGAGEAGQLPLVL